MNVLSVVPGGSRLMWGDQPAALTELFGTAQNRTKVDLATLLSNVKHAKVSVISDATDTAIVRPSDWNAAHVAKALKARLVVNILAAGVAGAQLRAQYSTDGLTWNYLDGATGPATAIDSVPASGVAASAWVTITAGAIADVFLRVVGINGNAVADPEFGLIQLQVQ